MDTQKLRFAVDHPDHLVSFAVDLLKGSRELASQNEYLKLLDFWYTEIGGRSIYVPYHYWRNRKTVIEKEIMNSNLLVPLSDKGIAHELIIHGKREHKTTDLFRNLLQELNEDVENVTVVEAGANIGYYLVQEAELLDDQAQIHAFEPVPDNIHFLRKNIRRNGIEDVVDLHPIAASNERGEVQMLVDTESNWAHVSEEGGSGTISVDAWPVGEFLEEQGTLTDSVNLIRMDVEGFEFEVLEGMDKVLSESSPLLLQIELHVTQLRENGKLDPLLDLLEESGFEVRAAHRRRTDLEIDSINDLRAVTGAPNIFLYKE